MRFSGKCAIVTGGAGAIGGAIVSRFAEEGARVVIPLRDEKITSQSLLLPSQLLSHVELVPCDLTHEADVERLRIWLAEGNVPVDFLIHAVGAYAGGARVEDTTIDEWEKMLRTNLTSSFLVSRLILPLMRERDEGRIVFLAAAASLKPSAKRSAYAVSKRAVVTLMECLTEELKGTGITVNAIAPGTVLTEANRVSMPDADPRVWVAPEEIAATAAFLCSPEAKNIHGSIITMTGG